jgi:hypothetical protein
MVHGPESGLINCPLGSLGTLSVFPDRSSFSVSVWVIVLLPAILDLPLLVRLGLIPTPVCINEVTPVVHGMIHVVAQSANITEPENAVVVLSQRHVAIRIATPIRHSL